MTEGTVAKIHPLTDDLAAPLALLEEEAHGSSLTKMLQGLNRFLCEKMVQDYKSLPPYSSALEQVLNSLNIWLALALTEVCRS